MYVDLAREHESLNITSRHKAVILVVSVSDLIAEVLGFGFDEPDAAELLDQFKPHIGLSNSDVEYYMSGFVTDVKEDSLYQECQELFGLKES